MSNQLAGPLLEAETAVVRKTATGGCTKVVTVEMERNQYF